MKRNLISTKKGYVEKLKEMLDEVEPCKCCRCPGHQEPYPHCAKLCTSFIDLPPYPEVTGRRCPCYQLGKKEALARAHLAIEAWDAGEHP